MTLSRILVPVLVALTASTTIATIPPVAHKDGCYYQVNGVGRFNTHLSADFTALGKLPKFLIPSTDTIGPGDDPYSHIFEARNVQLLGDGALSLFVNASRKAPIPSAEVATRDEYLYGSVRTVAKVSSPPGTCNGIFFYRDDNHEIDIEIRTHSKSNIWYTNQALYPGAAASDKKVRQKLDLSQAYHEYRIDWLPGTTRFYFDGRLQHTCTTNVPAEAASFVWNNWASGGEWTGSLPNRTGAMKIRSIDAYFNNTQLSCGYA